MGGKFLPNLNMTQRPIAEKYCEGKLKRIVKTKLKVPEIVSREQFGGCEDGRGWFTTLVLIGGRSRRGEGRGPVEPRRVLTRPRLNCVGSTRKARTSNGALGSLAWSGLGDKKLCLGYGLHQGSQPPRSACSYRSHTLNIPSCNTDQGVHQSWEYYGEKTINAQWKWIRWKGWRALAHCAGPNFFEGSERN